MKFHYDVCGAEPIVRDIRIANGGAEVPQGAALTQGAIATAEMTGAVSLADPDVLSNIVGVCMETVPAASLSVVATGVDYYAKVCINPMAVWLAKYSQAAADDVPLTAADATGKTCTITQVTDHERGWCYITNVGGTTGGYGNLFQIGAVTGTTVVTAATSYDDDLSANIIGDTAIVLHAPFSADVAGGSVDLSTNAVNVSGNDAGAGAGAAIVIENYIVSASRPMEMLRCAKHSGYNYASEAPQFYGDLMFMEHLLCAGGVVNDRVIT